MGDVQHEPFGPTRDHRDRRASRRLARALRSPIVLFGLSGLLAAIVIGAIGVLFTRHQAEAESLRAARNLTRVLAATLRPNLTDALLSRDPSASADLDTQVRRRALVAPVIRIKVWSPSGTIVYSDEHRLVGSVYPLKADDRAALDSGSIDAEISDVSRPENRFERGHGRILEVYMPVQTSTGHRLLFETYQRYGAVSANGEQLFVAFTPALLAGLGLLWLIQLPMAWSLARRLRRHQDKQEQLLLRALDASDVERRRIASDLHDTVVQDLLGVSYGLAAAGVRVETATPEDTRRAFGRAASQLRENLRHLRTLLVEIYPASARSAGLAAALEEVVGSQGNGDLELEFSADREVQLDEDAEELVYRTAQEVLRNVREHARAAAVRVSLQREDGHAVLLVTDDGVGFDAETIAQRRGDNHLGLALLEDRARRLGGTLSIVSSPGAGTAVRLELPLR